jgi:5-methylcytosine-specific restriction protein B
MSLSDYTAAGDKETFTYWMESRLDEYGSIWGGSAFKFGIYSRNDTAEKQGDTALAYDDQYGWYRRFGATHDAAFETVRREVVAVAEAARAGRLAGIDGSELGPSYRWKIAFHYQDRSQSRLFPCVFLRKPLLHACGLPDSDRSQLSELYERAARLRRPDEPLMDFSRRVWRDWVMATPLRIKLTEGAVRNGYIPVSLVSAPFPESIRGGDNEVDAGEPVRFRTDTGWEFESDVRAPGSDSGRIRTRFGRYYRECNVQPGDVIQIQPDEEGVYLIAHFPKGTVPPVPGVPPRAIEPAAANVPITEKAAMPVNRILFGPPGTGKTYRTVDEALRILDPTYLSANESDRAALKHRFDVLSKSGNIRFVTFHQSFSYEDFVEGIRADADGDDGDGDEVGGKGGGIRYRVEPGVFKQLCDAARSRTVSETGSGIDIAGRRVWKISLGDANSEQHIFEECMEKGLALMGFGSDADLSGVTSRAEIVERLRAAGEQVKSDDYPVTALDQFVRRVKVGDLVVVSQGNLKFRAIGEVTGDYVHVDRDGIDSYSQGRPVRWLRQYQPARPYTDLMESRFTQKTIYEPGTINRERLAALLASERSETHEPEARVLIIDEINRGNVSRIFGELITLIEPSKRAGADEALEVTLPYSKERFSVPSNVHLIGTMNTADRSLAGLDVALRRRFEFVEMLPDLDALAGVVVEGVPVDVLLSTMNRRIEVLLGRDYMLGHAYFMGLKAAPTLASLAGVFRRQVLPLLQEYFFADWQKIAMVLNDHRGKPDELRFLQQANGGMSDLLGEGVDLPGEGRLWTINSSAFERAEAYLAIIKAPQGAE